MTSLPSPPPTRRLLAPLLAGALLAAPAAATWSIVVVDTRTREVAAASATCIRRFDLKAVVPVVVVGHGAGATQASADTTGVDDLIIFEGLRAGLTAQEILDEIALNGSGSLQIRQYGVVTDEGTMATFSGDETIDWAGGVVGRSGDLVYAIQGNILTGPEVVAACEQAFLETEGDLGQRVMAGMQAARRFGGDGRCSCDPFMATSCGAPPPSFAKSAHVGFVILARMGDTTGPCKPSGCANGSYYLCLNVPDGAGIPDPVIVLQQEYDAWRAGLVGEPDGLLSRATLETPALPADGVSRTRVTVRLVDVDGVPLTAGGTPVRTDVRPRDAAFASTGPVTDHGDGTYSFDVIAGTTPGTAGIRVFAEAGGREALIFPLPEVRVDPAEPLHCGYGELVVPPGTDVPFTLNEPAAAGAPFAVLGSLSGTSPGTRVLGTLVPLEADPLFLVTLRARRSPLLSGLSGILDGTGRGEAVLPGSTLLLPPLFGQRLDWAALVLGSPPRATNPVGFAVGVGP